MEATLLIASAIAQIREEALLAASQHNGHFEFFESTVDNALGYYTSHSSPTRFFLSRARFVLTTAGESVPASAQITKNNKNQTHTHTHTKKTKNRKTRVVSLLRSSHPLRVRVFPADAAADAQHLGRGDLIEQRHGLAGVHHE